MTTLSPYIPARIANAVPRKMVRMASREHARRRFFKYVCAEDHYLPLRFVSKYVDGSGQVRYFYSRNPNYYPDYSVVYAYGPKGLVNGYPTFGGTTIFFKSWASDVRERQNEIQEKFDKKTEAKRWFVYLNEDHDKPEDNFFWHSLSLSANQQPQEA